METRDYLSELLGTVQDWQARALCAQTDPEAFFPEKGGSTRDAKRICARCDVRDDCLKYALEHDERFGIWGGLSERERRKIKRQAREAAQLCGDVFRPLVIAGGTPMITTEAGGVTVLGGVSGPADLYGRVPAQTNSSEEQQPQRVPVGV